MLKGKVSLVICFLFFTLKFSSAQEKAMPVSLDSLRTLAGLIQRGENDSTRISADKIFLGQVRALLLQSSFPVLDSIKSLSVLVAPDNAFRLVTWTRPSYETAYSFHGFIQQQDKKTLASKVTELVDSSAVISKPEAAKLPPGKWYGAVYYKILLNKKGDKKYYTLLGWKGSSSLLTQKVMDVLYFSGDKITFGYPFFKTEKVYRSRVIFEYVSQASVSLRYEEGKKLIVVDHLSAGKGNEDSRMKGPDGTYDAFRFKNGRWDLLRDVDVNAGFVPRVSPVKVRKDEELKKK